MDLIDPSWTDTNIDKKAVWWWNNMKAFFIIQWQKCQYLKYHECTFQMNAEHLSTEIPLTTSLLLITIFIPNNNFLLHKSPFYCPQRCSQCFDLSREKLPSSKNENSIFSPMKMPMVLEKFIPSVRLLNWNI